MRTRPFLSHRRADRNAVVALKRTLSLYGVGGWRDLDDLHLGELGTPGFEHAINEVTGGFLWYGTRRVLDSRYVNTVELPLACARKRRERDYPLVPLFVTMSPREARSSLRSELSAKDHGTFFDANGDTRGRMRPAAFHNKVAQGYIRSAVKWLAQDSYSLAVTALTEPAGHHDFTFDWRGVLDERTRVLTPGSVNVLTDALHTLRDAVKPATEFPELTLDLDMPLPLAILLGFEWRVTSRVRLIIRQRRRSGIMLVEGDGVAHPGWPDWQEKLPASRGACVLAVATTRAPLTEPLARYADEVGAARTLELHSPGELDAPGLRGLARHVARKLRDVNASGVEKHLLLAGPCALAALIGAGSNANGPVTVPFWDGSRYVSPISVG